MRPIRLPAFALLAALGLLAACAAPNTGTETTTTATTTYAPGNADWGPGDYCQDTNVIVTDNARTNFSLGSENYRNNDYCAAYPYLKWLLANDPLFTGEDPDDRNFLRLAGVYEQFASQADSADRKVWLDSSIATRQAGRQAMDAAGVEYESYLRDLVEGFFYYQWSGYYDDASERQYTAFQRAFASKPDSLEDWYLGELFIGSAEEFPGEPVNEDRAQFVERLATYTDDQPTQQYYMSYVQYLRTEPPEGGLGGPIDDTAINTLVAAVQDGSANCDQVLQLLGAVLQDPERIEEAGHDPAALQTTLVRSDCVTDRVDNPRTLLALALQAFRDGDSARGDQLFNRALSNAPSNAARANYFIIRDARGFGGGGCSTALQYDPTNATCRYQNLAALGRRVGRPSSIEGRFNYWCLADRYRQFAASTSDSRLASAARSAAAQYDRAGPSREQYFFAGYKPGQTVSCGITGGTTRIR